MTHKKNKEFLWFPKMKHYDPPFEKCNDCYYWRQLTGASGRAYQDKEFACHFCYENNKTRDGDLTYCNSFDPKERTRKVVRPFDEWLY